MKKENTNLSKFIVASKRVEILNYLNDRLTDRINDNVCRYEVVGKKQAEVYDREIHEYVPQWEDEEKTIPVLEDVWDYVLKPELDDDERAYLSAAEYIRGALENLL